MFEIRNGDLFSAPSGLICHQVNCKGKMGAGIALTFRKKYPEAYRLYAELCYNNTPDKLLGTCLVYKNAVCMFAQDGYGSGVQTKYDAFRNCCKYLANTARENNMIINMPYGIGCGLAGGDWIKVYSILREEFKGLHVILWKL